MAKKLDCDRKTVINYEQGVCEPKTSQLFQWLSVCKIDLKPLAAQLQNIKNSVFVIFAIAYLSSEFMMSLYISLLVLLLTFGVIRKNIVIATSTSILLFMNLIEYYTFLFLMDFLSSLDNKTPWHSSLIFIAQAVISFSIIFLLMYQNSIVRLPLFKPWYHNRGNNSLLIVTHAYFTITSLITALEYVLHRVYSFKNLAFLYNNYENFIYAGWAVIMATLLSMVTNDLNKQP
ncbi:hypothetical protein PAUR_b1114 [Pseudoalteromonas aurantia 208]|uniref:HTH cro/C1-type domain-containing protein n=2 Tax=Pseudoalteromonas aurantia TaxID=43654 RepID=A0ABR9EMP0_9GAMM|nr:hypothetical protein [Pseudoalteromonas aurantia 208]